MLGGLEGGVPEWTKPESDGAKGRVCLLRLERASFSCFSDFFSLFCEIWGSQLEMSGEKMLSQNDG